ncbi:hypothetical protein [Planctomicrobium sp. SH664]|uniref:hypothetical protein n=1 Tax=Planctomicrobium sp. SH664 TaxID=3448125 RepID=UPI003F5C6446
MRTRLLTSSTANHQFFYLEMSRPLARLRGDEIMKRFSLRQLYSQTWLRHAATGLTAATLLTTTSSCSSVNRMARSVFHRDETALADASNKEAAKAIAPEHKSAEKDKEAALAQKETAKPDSKAAALAGKAAKPAEKDPFGIGEDPFATLGGTGIQQTALDVAAPQTAQADIPFGEKPRATPIHHEAEPRLAADPAWSNCPPGGPAVAATCPTGECPPRPFPGAEYVGDEYVCDGGDKGIPVHYEGKNRAGLGLEDTVAEYIDSDGKRRVKPSTEACVYAPRFGAVRSATTPVEDLSIEKALGHQDEWSLAALDAKAVLDEKVQTDEVQDLRIRSRVSGLEGRTVDDKLNQTVAAARHIKTLNAFENIQFFREGLFDRIDIALLEASVDSAVEWSGGRSALIIAHDQSGQIVQGRSMAQDMTGVEDRRTPGDLRIVKVADRKSGHPGDIVTFTIRFDNVGDKELTRVRVVDNLSPRLEYIENSVDSNLDGQIHTDDNGAGGKLLTFEFDQPLKGKTGGFVSFQCRLR